MNHLLKNDLTEKMNKAMIILEKELSGLRTGRSSANLLDPVVVELYGSKMPISQVGTVSTPDAKTISVQVWDKAMVKTVEKAIADANLGLNPSSDGQIIRMSLPILSQERRKELVKKASEYCEGAKIAIRNVRRDAIDVFKKMEKDKRISEDQLKNLSDKVQKSTDVHTKKADEILDEKSKEIMKI